MSGVQRRGEPSAVPSWDCLGRDCADSHTLWGNESIVSSRCDTAPVQSAEQQTNIEEIAMCYPVSCNVCGKTTWDGCGEHIDTVKAGVPAEQWCDGQHPSAG